MGARGFQPTPTEVLKLRGSRRIGDRSGEPTDEVLAPSMPEWLQGEAAAEWERVIPLLIGRRTVSLLDRAVLSVYCQSWADFVAYSGSGDAKRVDEAAARLLKAADRLGLSPAAKSRVQTYGGDKQEKQGVERFRLGNQSAVA
jgi:phage terminase small subunit